MPLYWFAVEMGGKACRDNRQTMKSPALKTALVFGAGIILGHRHPIPQQLPVIGIALIFLLFTSWMTTWKRLRGKTTGILLFALLFLTGFIRISVETWQPAGSIEPYLDGPPVTLKATLCKDPEYRTDRTRYWLTVDSLQATRRFFPVKGRVLLTRYHCGDTFEYGDEIILSGELRRPAGRRNPGGFDYRAYLFSRKITGILVLAPGSGMVRTGIKKGHFIYRLIYPVRRQINRIIETIHTGETEAILKALILGDRGDISEETLELFSSLGIIHVLAVSGLHVGFVLLLLNTIFGLMRLPGNWRLWLNIFGLIFFALLTEAKPPVVRATVMAVVYLLGKCLGRQSNPLNALGVAGILLLMINPLMLFDAGFQLSFSAVFSILYLYPRINSWHIVRQINSRLVHHRLVRAVWMLFLVSLSAQLGTLTVVLTVFNRVSLLGMITNLFAVPLIGLIVAYGFTSLLIAPFSLWLGQIYGYCTEILMRILLGLSRILVQGPVTVIHCATPTWMAILLMVTLLFMGVELNIKVKKKLILISLLLLNGWVWLRGLSSDASALTWVQLDVGQGDAAVFHLPKRKILMIDGGDRSPGFDSGKRIVAPYLHHKGVRNIDALILTHAHDDHVGGLIAVLSAFKVRRIYLTDTLSRAYPFVEFLSRAKKLNIPVQQINAPYTLRFPGVSCVFLSPDSFMCRTGNENNRSLVSLITFGKHRFLCMGDAEKEAEAQLIQTACSLDADIIKIGHHGSQSSSSPEFLEQIRPDHAIISVGKRNRFNHPDQRTISVLNSMDVQIHRTDLDRAVIFHSDGYRLKQVQWKQMSYPRLF
jgi:competence protein ComEC